MSYRKLGITAALHKFTAMEKVFPVEIAPRAQAAILAMIQRDVEG